MLASLPDEGGSGSIRTPAHSLSAAGLLSASECDLHLGLYHDALELGIGSLALFTLPSKRCIVSPDPLEISRTALLMTPRGQNVYLHTALHTLPQGEQPGRRGSRESASVVIGLVSDIDAVGPGRRKPQETLCPSVADALSVTKEFGMLYAPLSAIIGSGYGLYPWLLFKEPFVIENDDGRERLETLGRRYHEALIRIASRRGWTGAVDYCDLAKVIRLAGSVNLKDQAAPAAVRFQSMTPTRFNISDLEEMLPEVAPSRQVAVAGGQNRNAAVAITKVVPPSDEFIAVLTGAHEKFGDTWNHRRTDLLDRTCSGFDMALAAIGVACSMSDEKIAGLLIESRRRFQGEKRNRKGKDYINYLARTIEKARSSRPTPKATDDSVPDADEVPQGVEIEPRAARPEPTDGVTPDAAEVAKALPAASASPATPVRPTPAPLSPVPPTPSPTGQAPPPLVALTAITKKEVVKRVSDRLMARHHFARDAAERLYVYKDGIYIPCDLYVRRQTQILLEEAGLATKWSSHHGREVVQYTMLKSTELWREPPLHEINVLNGILDARDGTLRKHTPDFLSPIQIPVTFDPTANCPTWEQFIEEVFPDDTVELAWEILGDLITPDRSIQKAGLLVGEGGNGKGVFLAGCIAFVGLNNVSTVPLHKLESDRFSVARLYGKLLNCCADLPSSDLESTSMFKALTGGDMITGERKYEHAFDFKPYARLLFSANHPPRSRDASRAFFDRWVVIPFNGSFRGTKREQPRSVLDAALADPKELSGVLNHALPALQRVRATGRFTDTESTRRALAEMKEVTDPLAVWLDRETVSQPRAFVPCGVLLRAFNADCSRRNRPPTNATAFGMALRGLRPGIVVKRRGPKDNQRECYVGIGLKADPEFAQDTRGR